MKRKENNIKEFLKRIKLENQNLPEHLAKEFATIISNAEKREDYLLDNINKKEVLFAVDCLLNKN